MLATRYTDQEVHMPFMQPPDGDAREFGALVAARILYDLWATERNVAINAVNSVNNNLTLRSETTFVRHETEPAWSELPTSKKQEWLDRGHEAVSIVLRTERFE